MVFTSRCSIDEGEVLVTTHKPLTAGSTVAQWLDHPEGGPFLRNLLAQAGTDPDALAPARNLPLKQVVAMSQGAFPQEVVDQLVLQANGGVAPEEDLDDSTWHERIVPERFTGRVVVVTGAGSGIGRAVASRVAREGGRVIGVDVNTVGLEATAQSLDADTFVGVTANITLAEDVERIVAAAGERVDALANVAGVVDDFSPVHETSDAVWQRCFAVNVDGAFRLSRAFIPLMLAAGRGSIVNVASEAALRGNAAGVAYTASKHAVLGLTRSTAFMYGPQGIRTNAVAPGGVATGMAPTGISAFGQERTSPFIALMPPVALAEHLAASITFLLSDDAVNINGAVLTSDGGWSVQ
ncbi:SDR family NAD(P)-dependent oxidoreductase [Cellulomonas sp. McL0617]|uniref:SDR family NAD(P)-dependent oxidoreductase n=1 Tax=Cellulomonas sp. McL0617 TaxID=3415675 RepID=UPI003CF4EB6A